MSEQWLTSLITKTPQEGYELAIKLSRMGHIPNCSINYSLNEN